MVPKKVSFGLWYSMRNPKAWETDIVDLYQEHLNQIVIAEKLGYDMVWLTEHHFCEDAHAPSILPLAAAISVKTKTIRIGTGVLLLPLHNAVRVAEDTATIDILSKGRFELGVGIGYRPEEFKGLGVSLSDRPRLMNEGLAIISELLRGKSVTFNGTHYNLDNLTIKPLPVQRPRPPVWVGGFVEESAKRAARFGDGYIGFGDLRDLRKRFLDEWHLTNRQEEPKIAGGHFWLVATRSPKKTFQEISPHVLYQMKIYNKWLKEAGQKLFPEITNVHDLKKLGILQCVSPTEACDIVNDYIHENKVTHYYNWTVPPGYPVKKMNEHLELFATEVIPFFR